jgi:HK97 family phage major capsid protein
MTDKIERFETKAALSVSDAGEVEAVAWIFAQPDRTGDVIEKNAISLDNATLPILWSHDPRDVIGVWDQITADDASLKVKGRLLIDDLPKAREVRAMIRSGAVSAVSIGFYTRKAAPRKGGGRLISSLDLAEVSIVAVPAHPQARITSAKSATHKETTIMENQVTEAAPEFAAIETKIGAVADSTRALVQRLDQIEARVNRPAVVTGKSDDDAAIERKALNSYFRGGVAALDEIERKTLNIGTPASGGYVVAPQYSATIVEKLTEISPMRRLAATMQIGTTSVYIPVEANPVDGNAWVTETGARPEDEPTFARINIPAHEHAVIVPVSLQLLEDSIVDLASYINGHIAKRFAKSEGTAFLLGDGSGKPLGLLDSTQLANYAQVVANQTTTGLAEKIIETFYALPSAYAANGSWLMNRKTVGVIRSVLDTAAATVWSDSLADGTPARLLGRPVVEDANMADILPETPADTYPIAFGDFASAYQIVDRVGVMLRLDDLTGADNGIVKVRARMRVGGKPKLAEAIVLLKSDAP